MPYLKPRMRTWGTPPVDSTISSAMTDIEDTQHSLLGTPSAHSTASSAMTDIEDTLPSPTETQSTVYKPEGKNGGLHWWKTPLFHQLNPKPGSRRTCQPPRVLALLDWKIQLPPLPHWWISQPVLPLWLTVW